MDEGSLSRAIRADNPRTETLERIGKVLDLTVDELCGEDDTAIVRPHRGVTDPALDDWEAQIDRWLEEGSAVGGRRSAEER